MYVYTKDEILSGLNEAWPHIGEYIQQLDESRATFERELYDETADNRRLRDENKDLHAQITELETWPESLQPPSLSEHISAHTPTTESPTDENEDFKNYVLKYDKRPDHWSLYMWQALSGWRTNPMSVPNALRMDTEGYFLEEDVDVAPWLNKVSGNLPRQAIMLCMKAVFGSCINFETAFSGFDPNLLRPAFQQS
ncbi:hypothetical protein M422DRAFT_243950 [Sphaerobolus stellatus SS14]|nr:hypothetical protein M422DRAFT_243950 [Sphaerobolus stellatus SS14]